MVTHKKLLQYLRDQGYIRQPIEAKTPDVMFNPYSTASRLEARFTDMDTDITFFLLSYRNVLYVTPNICSYIKNAIRRLPFPLLVNDRDFFDYFMDMCESTKHHTSLRLTSIELTSDKLAELSYYDPVVFVNTPMPDSIDSDKRMFVTESLYGVLNSFMTCIELSFLTALKMGVMVVQAPYVPHGCSGMFYPYDITKRGVEPGTLDSFTYNCLRNNSFFKDFLDHRQYTHFYLWETRMQDIFIPAETFPDYEIVRDTLLYIYDNVAHYVNFTFSIPSLVDFDLFSVFREKYPQAVK